MLGFVAAVAVATILAVVSALTLSTSGAIAHDFYVNWIKRGQVEGKQEVWIARIAAVVIGVLAIALGILAQGVNVAVLVILAICVAASANFPVLILSLFWRRFNTGGVVGGMTVGLVSSVVLAMIGPAMRGADALWPLVNPTVVSLPLGFLGAVARHVDLGARLAKTSNALTHSCCRFIPESCQSKSTPTRIDQLSAIPTSFIRRREEYSHDHQSRCVRCLWHALRHSVGSRRHRRGLSRLRRNHHANLAHQAARIYLAALADAALRGFLRHHAGFAGLHAQRARAEIRRAPCSSASWTNICISISIRTRWPRSRR